MKHLGPPVLRTFPIDCINIHSCKLALYLYTRISPIDHVWCFIGCCVSGMGNTNPPFPMACELWINGKEIRNGMYTMHANLCVSSTQSPEPIRGGNWRDKGLKQNFEPPLIAIFHYLTLTNFDKKCHDCSMRCDR